MSKIEHMNDGERMCLRRAVADYMKAIDLLDNWSKDGIDALALRDDAETRLASLLDVPERKGGGWNWEQYRTPR